MMIVQPLILYLDFVFHCRVLYFILKRKVKYDKQTTQKDQEDAAAKQADLGETTHM